MVNLKQNKCTNITVTCPVYFFWASPLPIPIGIILTLPGWEPWCTCHPGTGRRNSCRAPYPNCVPARVPSSWQPGSGGYWSPAIEINMSTQSITSKTLKYLVNVYRFILWINAQICIYMHTDTYQKFNNISKTSFTQYFSNAYAM